MGALTDFFPPFNTGLWGMGAGSGTGETWVEKGALLLLISFIVFFFEIIKLSERVFT